MGPMWWATIQTARVRRRLAGEVESIEEAAARAAAGRSFIEVGCMWNAHGRAAFAALDAGATAAVGVDLMHPTPEFEAEQERRGGPVRFVRGDVHAPAVREEIGKADVILCSGVLYHAPHPLATVRALREVCSERLLLGTITIPELPGAANAAVFFPGLGDGDRRAYDRLWPGTKLGLTTPFDPAEAYGPWYWGLSASAVRSLLQAGGFEVERDWGHPFTRMFSARAV